MAFFHSLRVFLLLFFGVWALISSINSQATIPTYNYHYCLDQSNATASASYKSNLVVLLDSLSTKASQNDSFYNETSNGSYGLFLCRGDVSNSTCQSCVSFAIQDLMTNRCPSNRSAIIWYDQCMLRYANSDFFGVEQALPGVFMWNVNNRTVSPNEPNYGAMSLIDGLIEQALASPMLFKSGTRPAAVGSETRYGLVQCSRDIDITSCSNCFSQLKETVNQCCQEKNGWRVLGPSCNIRYENYSFVEQPPTPEPSQPVPPAPQPQPATKGGNNTKKIVIITVSTIAVVAALLGFWFYLSFGKRKRREGETSEVILLESMEDRSAIHFMDRSMHARGPDSSGEVHYFNLNTMKIATNNFSDANKLGQGGFGPVYKGKLVDGKEVAVKRLSTKSKQGLEEFKNEVMFIVKLQHRNLVRLLGCCLEGGEKLLVYEYMANTSLDAFLFDPKKCRELDWAKRANIVNGIARGILYLHEDSRLKIIHRDLKASNVLLDDDMNPKISDFGTARYFGATQIEANTNRVVGTYGYMAPEYALEGLFSIKSDVYSFGVLVLEIVSGKKNTGFYHPDRAESLIPHVWQLWNEGKAMELIDQTLAGSYPESEALRLIHIALLCIQEDPSDRPTMSLVVIMLGSQLITLPQPLAPPFSTGRYVTSDQSTSTGAGTGFATSDQSSTGASQ